MAAKLSIFVCDHQWSLLPLDFVWRGHAKGNLWMSKISTTTTRWRFHVSERRVIFFLALSEKSKLLGLMPSPGRDDGKAERESAEEVIDSPHRPTFAHVNISGRDAPCCCTMYSTSTVAREVWKQKSFTAFPFRFIHTKYKSEKPQWTKKGSRWPPSKSCSWHDLP